MENLPCSVDARRLFKLVRFRTSEHLYRDGSYSVFDAMSEMCAAADDLVRSEVGTPPQATLWAGGSLGRREMLPNSDVDLFVIHETAGFKPVTATMPEVDKFEVGNLSISTLAMLAQNSLVDANRIIEGRPLGVAPGTRDVMSLVQNSATPDRQLANIITHHFFLQYHDFARKRRPFGSDIKYCSGSARTLLLLSFCHWLEEVGGAVQVGNDSDILQSIQHFKRRDESNMICAVEFVLLVKNAAMSCFYATGDHRVKYVSRLAFDRIYEVCREKLAVFGCVNADMFFEQYRTARRKIEVMVGRVVNEMLARYLSPGCLHEIVHMSKRDRLAFIASAELDRSEHAHSLASLVSWLIVTSGPTSQDVDELARALIHRPEAAACGGIMAVACSPEASDSTIRFMLASMASRNFGAYVWKMFARNPAASQVTQTLAVRGYQSHEVIV